MRKERIYLDTSVISYLDQQDSPLRMDETQEFWKFLKTGFYEVVISSIALDELSACSETKRKKLLNFIDDIDFVFIQNSIESANLAKKYIDATVLTEKSYVDCHHIALATIHECEYIASWNFKHMANVHTMKKVLGVNMLQGYREVKIYPPIEFLYEDK